MKKSVILVLALALLVSLIPSAGAATTVYFTSVNDSLLDLESDTMPVSYNNVMYVPYSVFTSTGLGIFYAHNKTSGTFTLYNSKSVLVFDLATGNSYTPGGADYTNGAATYNSRIYLPVVFVCSYFGLDYSYINTDIAPIVRIKDSSVILNDSLFASSANSLMRIRLTAYNRAIETPPATSGSAVTPSATSPTHSEGPDVCLTFENCAGDYISEILDVLDEYGCKATFFLTKAEIRESDELVRRIVASGHAIGISGYLTSGTSATASVLGYLEEANDLLDEIVKTRSRIIAMPGDEALLTDGIKAALAGEGYCLIEPTIDAVYKSGTSSSAAASGTVKKIRSQKYEMAIRFEVSETTLGALPTILRFLENEDYNVRIAAESMSRLQ